MRRLIAAVCVVAGIAAVICICRHGEKPVTMNGAHRMPTREIASFKSAANVRQDVQSGPLGDAAHVPLHIASVPAEAGEKLFGDICNMESKEERGEAASEKNQLMDALLNQPTIPEDYGATMIALFRDKTQDVVTRDFAVQHIGLYAQALNRRGRYDPDSRDAKECRAALFDAATETRTIVAAAAFRALAEMAGFDYSVDAGRLDGMIASCVADELSAPAVRVMAAQLCGERRIMSAKDGLVRIVGNPDESAVLRRASSWAVTAMGL